MNNHNTPEKNYDLERLVFFSDGVFAIAITLLVIEMHPPEHWNGTWHGLLMAIGAKLVFYVISFFSLGGFWVAHRFIFRHMQKFNEPASFLNLIFLCLICLMPLVNGISSEYGLPPVIFQLYIGEMVVLSCLAGLLWAYVALIAKLTDPRLTTAFKWLSLARLTLSPLLIGGLSLWIGVTFGIWPSITFMFLGFFVSSRIKMTPYKVEPSA